MDTQLDYIIQQISSDTSLSNLCKEVEVCLNSQEK